MKVAVLQSNYLPWKGYFDIINSVDTFIFYDDVQFTKNDWRNRNKIKTTKGTDWISIPCGIDLNRLVNQVEIQDNKWRQSHWGKIVQNYRQAPFFKDYKDFFEEFFLNNQLRNLSEINQLLIRRIATELLDMNNTRFETSAAYELDGRREERLLNLLKQAGAKHYLSGPSAKSYIDEDNFKKAGIQLEWANYTNYPEYEQLYPPFEHYVSVIDLIFNVGKEFKKYMLSYDPIQ